jgi:hypothetical protein
LGSSSSSSISESELYQNLQWSIAVNQAKVANFVERGRSKCVV